jgi:hypothetical protein
LPCSKMDAGGVKLRLTVGSIAAMLADVTGQMRMMAQTHGVVVQVGCAEGVGGSCLCRWGVLRE